MHNGTKQRPQMQTIRNPLYYLRKLVLASKVERLSVWNAVHLVHFGPLLDYCPIWFFSKKKKKSPIWFTLVYFSPIRSSLDNLVNSINFSPFQYTSVQFCPLWTISVHIGLFRPIQSITIHFGPIHSTSIHFGPRWSIFV